MISIGKAHNVSAAQVALRWLVQQEITVVTAADEPAYIAEDLDLWSFQLRCCDAVGSLFLVL